MRNPICIIILVPVWINVQIVSGHSNEKSKKDNEQRFGKNFQLAGFKNGAPFYSDVKEEYCINKFNEKTWHMIKATQIKKDDGWYYLKLITSGKFWNLEPFLSSSEQSLQNLICRDTP